MDADIEKIIPCAQIVVVGHVDVGKSTFTGRMLQHYGDPDITNKKIRDARSSMEGKQVGSAGKNDAEIPVTELRFLCDNSSHERTKGNTINYHSTGMTLKFPGQPDKFANLCDAPGHTDYTKNLVAGTSQADVALMLLPASQLALASSLKPLRAKKGGKESDDSAATGKKMPSVLDHQLRILNTFGVQVLLVGVNKMAGGATSHTGNETGSTTDIIPYDEDMYNRIVNVAREVIKKNGFKDGWFHFIPIDVFNCDNLWEKSKNMPWYKGIDFAPKVNDKMPYAPKPFHADSVVEFLVKLPLPPRRYKDPLRMVVHNVYSVPGQGNVYSCKIYAGLCTPDKPLMQCPAYYLTKAKTIEVHKTRREAVGVGDECAMTLFKIDAQRPPIKGHIFCPPESPAPKVTMFVAKVMFLGVQEEIKSGYTCTWDCHVVHSTVIVERILDATAKSGADLQIKGNEPECLTWNPVLTPEQVKAGKELQRKKNQDAKFKLTEEDEKLLTKMKDPYHFEPCGQAYLDSLTTPLVGGRENKTCIIRFKPMDSVVCTTYQDNGGLGRFGLRSSGHVVGIGVILRIACDSLDYVKKAAAKNK